MDSSRVALHLMCCEALIVYGIGCFCMFLAAVALCCYSLCVAQRVVGLLSLQAQRFGAETSTVGAHGVRRQFVSWPTRSLLMFCILLAVACGMQCSYSFSAVRYMGVYMLIASRPCSNAASSPAALHSMRCQFLVVYAFGCFCVLMGAVAAQCSYSSCAAQRVVGLFALQAQRVGAVTVAFTARAVGRQLVFWPMCALLMFCILFPFACCLDCIYSFCYVNYIGVNMPPLHATWIASRRSQMLRTYIQFKSMCTLGTLPYGVEGLSHQPLKVRKFCPGSGCCAAVLQRRSSPWSSTSGDRFVLHQESEALSLIGVYPDGVPERWAMTSCGYSLLQTCCQRKFSSPAMASNPVVQFRRALWIQFGGHLTVDACNGCGPKRSSTPFRSVPPIGTLSSK